MQTFLEQVANHAITKYGDSISEVCFVFPNRRAGLFLKRHLAAQLKKTFWAPQIFSAEDFVVELSGLKITDNISLLFEFYKVHQKIAATNAQDFDGFADWGQILLHDFNDVDLYLVNAKLLYNYLKETKEISEWDLSEEGLSPHQKKYIEFYSSFYQYYQELQTLLSAKNLAYQGMAFRQLAENIENVDVSKKWKKIIFAGFNALNKAEEKIITTLVNNGYAEILWDTDSYYLDNNYFEAGNFIRKFNAKFPDPEFKWKNDFYKNDKKIINIIGVEGNIGQVKYAGDLIASNPEINADISKTAVVLSDESLLIPFLNSLPENVDALNVTMGYGLSHSTFFSLVNSIIELHDKSAKISQPEAEKSFFYRDVFKIINHPQCLNLLDKENNEYVSFNEFLKNLIGLNKTILYSKEILGLIPENLLKLKAFLNLVFEAKNQEPIQITNSFVEIIALLRENLVAKYKNVSENSIFKIELEFLFLFNIIFNKINLLISEYSVIKTLKTYRSIFKQIINFSSLPFYGEPLKGLQLMGVLETRTLDFKNLIMLSVNEGVIPAGKSQNTFIPFDIKMQSEFNLPTYKDKEAVFAYHFYRLLQRAENIYLVYNSTSDKMGEGEKSRFITQIASELQKCNPSIEINHSMLSIPIVESAAESAIEIEKSPIILEKILEKAAKGFSASGLNNYISCPLKFYFNDIVRIQEIEDIDENVDAAMLGTILHEVLENFYKPYIGQLIVDEKIIEIFQKSAEKELEKSFFQNTKIKNPSGKNLLIYKVAKKYLENFLKIEKENIIKYNQEKTPLSIVDLEKDSSCFIEITDPADSTKLIKIKLKGIIDRIDSIGDTLRIIDYKTGSVDEKKLKFADFETLLADSTFSKAFQLLFYYYLFTKSDLYRNQNIECGIIGFKSLGKGFLKLNHDLLSESKTEEFFQKTEETIKEILSSIFNSNLPFQQTAEAKNCEYCNFVDICNK